MECLPLVSSDLVVESQEGNWRVNGLTRLGTQSHHLQPCAVDLLSQLVHGNVARGTHQHLPAASEGTIVVL